MKEERKGDSLLQGCSRKWVLFMNGVVLVSGIVLLTLAIFLSVDSGDIVLAIGQEGIVGPIVSGSVLVFVAGLGCCGVIYRNRFLLILYLLVATAMAGLFLGAGILFTFLAKDLGNVEGEQSNTLAGKVEGQLNDFLVAVFNECCAKAFPDDIDKLLGCNDPNANQAACFTFIDDYEAALRRVDSTGLCDTLSNVEVDGFPVVGDPNLGGCAGGNGALFKFVFTDLVEETLVPIGVAFITLSVLLMVTLIATCVVICATRKDFFVDPDDETKEKTDRVSAELGAPPPPNTFGVRDSLSSSQLMNGVDNPKYRPPYESERQIGF